MARRVASRGSDQFMVRFPDGMRDRIKELADEHGRSMNAEIIHRLELALSEDIWERQKFIDTLNFKQHIIDKQLHILFEQTAIASSLRKEAGYERALRIASEEVAAALSGAILASDQTPHQLKQIAASILTRRGEVPDVDFDAAKTAVARRVGDKDEVSSDWEEELSDEARTWLKTARQWSRPYE